MRHIFSGRIYAYIRHIDIRWKDLKKRLDTLTVDGSTQIKDTFSMEGSTPIIDTLTVDKSTQILYTFTVDGSTQI